MPDITLFMKSYLSVGPKRKIDRLVHQKLPGRIQPIFCCREWQPSELEPRVLIEKGLWSISYGLILEQGLQSNSTIFMPVYQTVSSSAEFPISSGKYSLL
jgi:hypothetical protein